MKKYISSLSLLLLLVGVNAQVNNENNQEGISVSDKKTVKDDVTFDGEWKITEDNSNYIVNGSSITNKGDKRTKALDLRIYMVPADEDADNLENQNYLKSINLKRIEGRGSSLKNLILTFGKDQIKSYENNTYIPVLVLAEKNTIVATKKLNALYLENGKIKGVVEAEEEEVVNVITEPKKVTTVSKSHVFKTVDYNSANKKGNVVVEGTWKLNIDSKNFTVSLSGKDNVVANKSLNSSNPIKIRVAMVKNFGADQSGTGYNLAEFSLKPLKANEQYIDLNMSTGILNRIPSGKYTPVLLVAEQDEKGNYVYNSTFKFTDQVTF